MINNHKINTLFVIYLFFCFCIHYFFLIIYMIIFICTYLLQDTSDITLVYNFIIFFYNFLLKLHNFKKKFYNKQYYILFKKYLIQKILNIFLNKIRKIYIFIINIIYIYNIINKFFELKENIEYCICIKRNKSFIIKYFVTNIH